MRNVAAGEDEFAQMYGGMALVVLVNDLMLMKWTLVVIIVAVVVLVELLVR